VQGNWVTPTIQGLNKALEMSLPNFDNDMLNTPYTTITNGGSGGVGTYTYGVDKPYQVSGQGVTENLVDTIICKEDYSSDYVEYQLNEEDWSQNSQLAPYNNPRPYPYEYASFVTSSKYKFTINIYGVK